MNLPSYSSLRQPLQLASMAVLALACLTPSSLSREQGSGIALFSRGEAGRAVRKTFTTDQKLQLTKLEARRGDQRIPSKVEMRLQTKRTLTVVDHVRAVRENGQPANLRRTFEKVERAVDVLANGVRGTPTIQPCNITGTSVVFQWAPNRDEYGKHYDATEASEGYLPGLQEDLDLRALLPAGGAATVGEKWMVPADQLAGVFAPGGVLQMESMVTMDPQTERSLRAGIGGSTFRVFQGCRATGGMEVQLVGMEEGGELARLDLRGDLRVLSDQTSYVVENAEPVERDRLEHLGADLVFEFRGQGILLWNVSEGRAHSMELAGTQMTSFDLHTRERTGNREDGGQYLRMDGTFELRLAAEPTTAPAVPGPGDAKR